MKTVLITGANRGLGLGFTRHYLGSGCRVFATARNPEDCAEFDALQRKFTDRFTPLKLDTASEASIAALGRTLSGEKLDLLINNAAILAKESFGHWNTESFDLAFRTNVTGPALISQALAPLMKPGGVIVNISSGLASCGLNINPEQSEDAYAASKAALNMITRRLAAKPALADVTVAAFDPGWVKTRMGGEEAELTVDESIGALTASIERLTPGHSGLFFGRGGDELPW